MAKLAQVARVNNGEKGDRDDLKKLKNPRPVKARKKPFFLAARVAELFEKGKLND